MFRTRTRPSSSSSRSQRGFIQEPHPPNHFNPHSYDSSFGQPVPNLPGHVYGPTSFVRPFGVSVAPMSVSNFQQRMPSHLNASWEQPSLGFGATSAQHQTLQPSSGMGSHLGAATMQQQFHQPLSSLGPQFGTSAMQPPTPSLLTPSNTSTRFPWQQQTVIALDIWHGHVSSYFVEPTGHIAPHYVDDPLV